MEFSDTAGRVVPRWFHVDSFFECADVEGRLTDIDQIDGADRLRCGALISFSVVRPYANRILDNRACCHVARGQAT